MKPSRIAPDLINSAADQFDPSRSNSENSNRMLDHLGESTGPLSRDEQINAEFDVQDEVARRKGNKIDFGF